MRYLALSLLLFTTACAGLNEPQFEEEPLLTGHWVFDIDAHDPDAKDRIYRPATDSTVLAIQGPGSQYRFAKRGRCSYLAAPYGLDRWFDCHWSWRAYEDRNELIVWRGFDDVPFRNATIRYEVVGLTEDMMHLRFISNSRKIPRSKRHECEDCASGETEGETN